MSDTKTRARKKVSHLGRNLSVSALAAATAMAGVAGTASAAIGGGGTGGGSGSGAAAGYFMLITEDNPTSSNFPTQGWGQDSINYFTNQILSWTPPGGHWGSENSVAAKVQTACAAALAQATERGGGNVRSRVVQVGMSMDSWTNNAWDVGGMASSEFKAQYDRYWPDAKGNLIGYTDSDRTSVYNTFVANIKASNPSVTCVALNEGEPSILNNYDLSVSTDKASTFTQAGDTNAVTDTIHASNGGSSVSENVTAKVILHWDGIESGSAKSVTKTVAIKNNGDTTSPSFSPSDFGWKEWPAGKFWFDVQVDKQGKMSKAVDTSDRDSRETWDAAMVNPTKVITNGTTDAELSDTDTLASGMFYNAKITANSNGYTSWMKISDVIATDKIYVGSTTADVASAAYVLDPDGKKVDGAKIEVNRDTAGQVTVSGTVSNLVPGDYTLVVPTYVQPTGSDYTVPDSSNVTYPDGKQLDGDSKVTRKVTPSPDKVWVLDEKGALVAEDADQTNQEGADQTVFLPGDSTGAVVNGRVAKGLESDLTQYSITDDWTDSAKYVDFSDASKAKVYYETAPGSGKYTDVTGQFDIKVSGTTTTATAKSDFLKGTAGQTGDREVKLFIGGTFRTDYDTNGKTVTLTNAGSETWNNETIPTNEPPVFTWTPNPEKYVLGSADEGGDQDSIDGLSVWAGQKIEYQVNVDLNVPGNLAHGTNAIKTLAVQDNFDANFTPDEASIEFYDARTQKTISKKNYTLTWDDASHSFTATFNEDWVKANVKAGETGWLILRFDGTVNDDTVGGTTVKNQAFQIINGAKTATEIPTVNVPSISPVKEDLDTSNNDIDGKTVVQGDIIRYRLTLDATPARSELAYNVHKLGMIDDYDENYLDVDTSSVKVTNKETGEDVTSKFNVQVIDGKLYVFAKTVDTTVNGRTISGDPQPSDLAAYSAADIAPTKDAAIDQSLLGAKYWVTFDSTVTQETDGYTIVNQAWQNTENTVKATNIVSNPLKDIDPTKDVVVDESTKDDSINGETIELNSLFNYRLNSSEIPANRAYKASQWALTDTFDKTHDSYTGVWAVYANSDVYKGDVLIFKKGDLLADSAGHESEEYKGLFDVTFDESTYTLTATATDKYLALVNSRGDLAQSFSVYTKMERIAPSEKVVNTVDETYNNVERQSNEVVTNTPENPAISVIKYTLSEGQKDGDRNTADQAFTLTADGSTNKDEQVGITVKNTGDVALKNVKITDATASGTTGTVKDITCTVPVTDEEEAALSDGSDAAAETTKVVPADEVTTLAVGQSVDCVGTLVDVEAGTLHSDTVTATGQSVFTGKEVSASDPWNAKLAALPATPTPTPGDGGGQSGDSAGGGSDNGAVTGVGVADIDPALIGLGLAALFLAGGLGTAEIVRRRKARKSE